MNSNGKRLVFYIFLNALVSACVTAGVLFVYDRYYRPSTLPEMTVADPAASGAVEIASVLGAGIPTAEMVLIRNPGESAVSLQGWQIRDADGNAYIFGAITLPGRAALQLRTAPGNDTVIDLYWGLTAPAWASGETATLLDSAGTVRSVYKVP